MTLSAVALCSRALLKLGAEAISSFNDNAPEAELASALYGPVRDALLSAHPWTFATGRVRMNRLPVGNEGGFRFAYQLPDGFLRAIGVESMGRQPGPSFQIAGRRLLTDAPIPTLVYVFRPPERDTPPFFNQALIARLAAEFCIPLTESSSRSQGLSQSAEAEFKRARQIDSQQHTVHRVADFSLIDVRGIGRG